MKVLMISQALIVGTYHGKLRELTRLGVELTIVVPHQRGRQKRELIEPSEYELMVAECKFSGANHFHFYPDIPRIVGLKEWDLIHIDEEPFNFVTFHILRASARSGGRPAVFFTWQNINKIYPPPFNYFEHFTFQHVQAAIAGNKEAQLILRKRRFPKPTMVIPQFGVDPGFFCKSSLSTLKSKLGLKDKFVIGYAGRVVK